MADLITQIRDRIPALRDQQAMPEQPWLVIHESRWPELEQALETTDDRVMAQSSNPHNNPPVVMNLPVWRTRRQQADSFVLMSEDDLQEALADEWEMWGGESYYAPLEG